MEVEVEGQEEKQDDRREERQQEEGRSDVEENQTHNMSAVNAKLEPRMCVSLNVSQRENVTCEVCCSQKRPKQQDVKASAILQGVCTVWTFCQCVCCFSPFCVRRLLRFNVLTWPRISKFLSRIVWTIHGHVLQEWTRCVFLKLFVFFVLTMFSGVFGSFVENSTVVSFSLVGLHANMLGSVCC